MKTRLWESLAVTVLMACWSSGAAAASQDRLVVHEWGTFTSFQSEDGRTIAGINVDDEPVPDFVHRLHELPIFTTASLPGVWSQGAPTCHSGVTLRLETPVLYFYPQAGFPLEQSIDVQVRFNGGWLTEFYPGAAAADMPNFPNQLDSGTQGARSAAALQFTRTFPRPAAGSAMAR